MSEAKVFSPKTMQFLLDSQRNELTESLIYDGIAAREKNEHNKKILSQIAQEEREHEKIWRKYTGQEVKPNKKKARWYIFLSRLLGFTFALKKMENGENAATKKYADVAGEVPEAQADIRG